MTRVAREEGGHVLALLAARFNDLDLADECVQDALVQALETWATQGIPDNPPAWLHTVARNRAIDRLRRRASAERRLREAAPELAGRSHAAADGTAATGEDGIMIVEHAEVGDEQLRLMLLCCHPALDRDAQIALTLRLVGGLTTAEIAAAWLVPEPTLAQRIVRAKRKIRDAGIPLTIPARLGERLDALLAVLYLIFNEGYLSRGTSQAVRLDLADQAIRLTSLAIDLLSASATTEEPTEQTAEQTAGQLVEQPAEQPAATAEAQGLLALQLYHRARAETRLDGAGDLVLLEDQDRRLWDAELIGRANRVLQAALARNRPGAFQVQALIASGHANARTAADTDWPLIADLYARLLALSPGSSPVVALNRAVAVAMADGPRAGLTLLDEIAGLDDYYLLHATRGELLARDGDPDAAALALARARELARNPAERRHLDRRIADLER